MKIKVILETTRVTEAMVLTTQLPLHVGKNVDGKIVDGKKVVFSLASKNTDEILSKLRKIGELLK